MTGRLRQASAGPNDRAHGMTARIVIVGAGYANKGAEAMLRTVQVELGKRLKVPRFLLWCPQPWEDELAAADLLAPLRPPFGSGPGPSYPGGQGDPLARLVRRVNRHTKAGRRRAEAAQARSAQECLDYLNAEPRLFDAVIDVSGFAYADQWGLAGYRRISPLVQHCRRTDKPVIFMPQAWGPFDSAGSQEALGAMLDGDNVHYYSRDSESSRWLQSVLGESNRATTPYPDIAFLFRGASAETGTTLLRDLSFSLDRPVVGIAPNMRVYERAGSPGRNNPYVAALASLAQHCLDHWEVDVLVQPNELKMSEHSDDRLLCGLIAQAVARPDRCRVANEYLSAESTWALLGRLDFLFASRFHSLVFALSQGVPAMALGWSHKYEELLSLFGWEGEVTRQADLDARRLLATADRIWDERASRREHLTAELPALRTRLGLLFDEVADYLSPGR